MCDGGKRCEHRGTSTRGKVNQILVRTAMERANRFGGTTFFKPLFANQVTAKRCAKEMRQKRGDTRRETIVQTHPSCSLKAPRGSKTAARRKTKDSIRRVSARHRDSYISELQCKAIGEALCQLAVLLFVCSRQGKSKYMISYHTTKLLYCTKVSRVAA